MSKKSFYLPEFIDEKKFFSHHKNHKISDNVVYKRLSDDSLSMGEIKWFEYNKKDGKIYVTLIDHILENFQTCSYLSIEPALTKTQLKKIKNKVAKRI